MRKTKLSLQILEKTSKQFLADLNGEFDGKRVLKNECVVNSEIANGQGEVRIRLALDFDDFGELESVLQPFNILKITACNAENPLGELIYTGYLGEITPQIADGMQEVEVSFFGLGTLFANSEAGFNFSNSDFGEMARSVVGFAQGAFPWANFSESIPDAGSTGSVATDSTLLDAMNAIVEKAGDGYFWAVRATGEVVFGRKSSTPDHTFTIGKDILRIKNRKSWIDEFSQNDYTQSVQLYLTQAYQGSEKIKVGDTCRILGQKIGNTNLGDNLQIARIAYTSIGTEIELEKIKSVANSI